ncbi:Endoplasmic reticulum-Golgi intermediate compartment protein 3 [Entamoeba marina]
MKRFDAYGKLPEDFRVRHSLGGILTIICAIIVVSLVTSEFFYYLQRETTPELVIDTLRNEKIPVHFDITFPYSSCSITSVDILTKSGESQIDIEQNVTKIRIHQNGKELTQSEIDAINNKLPVKEQPTKDQCLSCYGAETPKKKCCNTCEDVIEAYKKRGWVMSVAKVTQCQNNNKIELAKLTQDEGCRVVAPGSSDNGFRGHFHSIEWTGRSSINLTHEWNELKFGDDGDVFRKKNIDKMGNSMFQNYVTVVPNENNFLNGSSTKYSFSLNENVRKGTGEGNPGVFVYYDISPMIIKVTEDNHGFLHFLIGVCSIVGGIFTVFQLFDTILFQSIHTLQKKVELGKDL